MIKRRLCSLIAVFAICLPVYSQVFPAGNDRVLAGVTTFDAVLIVPLWLNVEHDIDRFKRNGQSTFELLLRRDGVRVDSDAPNYLICEISAAQSSGVVFYHYAVEYWEWVPRGLNTLLWDTGGVVTIGARRFSHEQAVSDCVDAFSNVWLKHNPR